MEYSTWKQNPRLKSMDPAKLDYIEAFAERIRNTPKNQLIPVFLSLQTEIHKQNMEFSNEETEILVDILTADMDAAQKQKLEMLKFFAKKLAARSS